MWPHTYIYVALQYSVSQTQTLVFAALPYISTPTLLATLYVIYSSTLVSVSWVCGLRAFVPSRSPLSDCVSLLFCGVA